MKLSSSAISKWMACSLQAKYAYVDGIWDDQVGSSAHYGSSVHAGLEAYHKGASVKESIQVFKDYYHSKEVDYWNNKTSETKFMDQGPKVIKQYTDNFKWTHHEILGAEQRFMVPFGNHILSGIVDLLYADKEDNLYIVDLKTGAKPTKETLYLNTQFTIYDWATRQKEFWCGTESDDPNWPDKYSGFENGEELYERFKDSKRINIWYDLRDVKPIDVGPRTDFDYARLYRVCEMIERAVETETYVPTISIDTCRWCAYKDLCPIWIPAPVDSTVNL